MGQIKVEYDGSRLKRNLRSFPDDLRQAIGLVTARSAAETTAWLKTNARWTDRTGAARSGLYAVPHVTNKYAEILMGYSVNYGIWLEVAHNRKYAVLTPAMRIRGAALMRDMNLLIERMHKR